MSELIKQNFELAKSNPSDINEHIDALYNLAKECEHITEMGVRNVVSTWAFMLRDPKTLIGIDLHSNMNVSNADLIYPKLKFSEENFDQIILFTKQDKKNANNQVRMVLLKSIGQAITDVTVSEEIIRSGLKNYLDDEFL
jgi:hypothetical protein